MDNDKKPVCITGLMVRNTDKEIIAEVEIDGVWVEVIKEWVGPMGFVISHIIEPAGIEAIIERKGFIDNGGGS